MSTLNLGEYIWKTTKLLAQTDSGSHLDLVTFSISRTRSGASGITVWNVDCVKNELSIHYHRIFP